MLIVLQWAFPIIVIIIVTTCQEDHIIRYANPMVLIYKMVAQNTVRMFGKNQVDLLEAFGYIEKVVKSDFFSSEKTYFTRVQHVLSHHLISCSMGGPNHHICKILIEIWYPYNCLFPLMNPLDTWTRVADPDLGTLDGFVWIWVQVWKSLNLGPGCGKI